MLKFSESVSFDHRLAPFDIAGSKAHSAMLAQVGLITAKERAAIHAGLDAILAEIEAGGFKWDQKLEDVHMNIEQALTKRVPAAAKLHTARSRNDQVATDMRLWFKHAAAVLGEKILGAQRALLAVASAHRDVLIPGYTHLQRAMPSTAALWTLGYAETLAGDLDALRHARRRINVSPLGSAAGYGVPVIDLPREAVADRLGFRAVQTHATAVQLSRGKHALAVGHACTQVGATCNRLASDLVLFATAEFDFVDLPPEHCTGSSIMPQKQNPDVLELARAYHHRLAAQMQSLATGPSNLPGGYHRDLQLTKAAVLRSVEMTSDVLTALAEVVRGVTFNPERTRAACAPDILATQRALERVAEGVPFRSAYQQAADAEPGPVDPGAVLDAYETDGTPGQERPDRVRSRLDAHGDWVVTP